MAAPSGWRDKWISGEARRWARFHRNLSRNRAEGWSVDSLQRIAVFRWPRLRIVPLLPLPLLPLPLLPAPLLATRLLATRLLPA